MRKAPEQHRELEPSKIRVAKGSIEMGELVALMREERDIRGLQLEKEGDDYVLTIKEGVGGSIEDMGKMAHLLNENEIDFEATENVMDQMREEAGRFRNRVAAWLKRAA